MASLKRPRENASVPETPIGRTLPADLMLEIVARSEPRVLFRCAAASKLLRHEILNPSFIRRVSHQVAPCILVHLPNFRSSADKPLALVHPATAGAASFCHDHLAPFWSRRLACLFNQYKVVTSRRGLVLLRRRNMKNRPKSDSCFDLCVYDPMSGVCTFFSQPPVIKDPNNEYVLLTAADGFDCSSFVLLAIDHRGCNIQVQTAASCGRWGPVICACDHDLPWRYWLLKNDQCNPAVLRGGVIHWLEYLHKQILSYDMGTGKAGMVELPQTKRNINRLHLATTSDGKLLKLLAIEGFTMSVWLQLPVSEATGGSGWSLEAVIDMEEKLRSLDPDIIDGLDGSIKFEGSGKRNGEVVFLEVPSQNYKDAFIVFDLETKEMHRQKRESTLLEIDLPARLQTMKIFS